MNPVVVAPITPMLARTEAEIPTGAGWDEPKWDGFRGLLHKMPRGGHRLRIRPPVRLGRGVPDSD